MVFPYCCHLLRIFKTPLPVKNPARWCLNDKRVKRLVLLLSFVVVLLESVISWISFCLSKTRRKTTMRPSQTIKRITLVSTCLRLFFSWPSCRFVRCPMPCKEENKHSTFFKPFYHQRECGLFLLHCAPIILLLPCLKFLVWSKVNYWRKYHWIFLMNTCVPVPNIYQLCCPVFVNQNLSNGSKRKGQHSK